MFFHFIIISMELVFADSSPKLTCSERLAIIDQAKRICRSASQDVLGQQEHILNLKMSPKNNKIIKAYWKECVVAASDCRKARSLISTIMDDIPDYETRYSFFGEECLIDLYRKSAYHISFVENKENAISNFCNELQD